MAEPLHHGFTSYHASLRFTSALYAELRQSSTIVTRTVLFDWVPHPSRKEGALVHACGVVMTRSPDDEITRSPDLPCVSPFLPRCTEITHHPCAKLGIFAHKPRCKCSLTFGTRRATTPDVGVQGCESRRKASHVARYRGDPQGRRRTGGDTPSSLATRHPQSYTLVVKGRSNRSGSEKMS